MAPTQRILPPRRGTSTSSPGFQYAVYKVTTSEEIRERLQFVSFDYLLAHQHRKIYGSHLLDQERHGAQEH